MVEADILTSGDAVHAALLDDDPVERERLADLLMTDELRIDTLGPTSIGETTVEISDLLGDHGPRVVLLDYRLDDAREAAKFRGGSVAAALRDADHTRDVPLVLLTTEAKLKTWVESRPGTLDLFDWRLLKGDITDVGLPSIRGRLVDLGRGYWELSGGVLREPAGWDRIAAALAAERYEIAALEELEFELPGGDAPAELARWILTGPLEWSGPLIDKHEARVVLGVTPAGFDSPAVQAWVGQHSYKGLFAAFGPRWWSAPLRAAIAQLAGPPAAIDSEIRSAALAGHLGVSLQAEHCSWCAQNRTTYACRICCRAVDAAHSVRMLTSRPPSWADAPVACFTCIAQGRADDFQLVREARPVIEQLQSGSLEQPKAL